MNSKAQYQPSSWEKVMAYAVALFIVLLISFLVIRDKPFSDPNFPIFIRILLSLSCAVLGAVIPGFLNVDLKAKGILIRAGGALALFIVTFFFTPSVGNTPGKIDTDVKEIQSRIEMLEATVKLLAAAANAPDTAPNDKRELNEIRTEIKSTIETAKTNPQVLTEYSLDVAIIVGHSPMTPGASGSLDEHFMTEFSYNVELAPLIVKKLSALGLRTEMFLRNSSGSVKSGIAAAVKQTPRLIVELHANAFNGEVRGSSALVRDNDEVSYGLAQEILISIHNDTGIPIRGVKQVGTSERGGVALYSTSSSAMILDPFFIDNKQDFLVATQEKDKLATAIASAIASSIKA